MLRALVYLHEGVDRKIIHRDLKPANVMLTSDFAIVKLTGANPQFLALKK